MRSARRPLNRPQSLRTPTHGSPVSGPGGPPSPAVSRRPGNDAGPNSAWRPGTPTADPPGTGHRGVVRPDGTGGPGDRLRCRNLDPGDGRRRTPPRRGRRRGLPPRARTAAQRCRPGGPDQRPAHPRRRRRRAGTHAGSGVADRRAGVLPRPVAQGAPPQAPAAAAVDGGADRRSPRTRRGAARRHRSRRVRRADRRGRRRRAAAAPGRPRFRRAADLGHPTRHEVRGEGPARRQRRHRILGRSYAARDVP